MLEKLTWKEAQKRLEDETKITYLEFATDLCGDCIMMKPVIEEFIALNKDVKNTQFIRVDAEEAKLFRDKKSKYKVLFVPTHVFLKGSKIQNILYEYVPSEILDSEFKKLF